MPRVLFRSDCWRNLNKIRDEGGVGNCCVTQTKGIAIAIAADSTQFSGVYVKLRAFFVAQHV